MIRNNDLQALSQVSDDLSFLVDQDRLNQAYEEVNKTEKKVYQTSLALKELLLKFVSEAQLK
jgi:hypothetical protein